MIVFTGGGTMGHIGPNMALLERVGGAYIGGYSSVESRALAGYPFYPIMAGKWRRYFSLKNGLDWIKVLIGIAQAFLHLRRLKPTVVFSKGGYVALPVVIAAWVLRIPVIIHESDVTLGLTTRISQYMAQTICLAVPETRNLLRWPNRAVVTGIPLRQGIQQGDGARGRLQCGFQLDRPVVVVFGGSLGAAAINACIADWLPRALAHFQVAHVVGNGPLPEAQPGYYPVNYIAEGFGDWLAMANVVVCRGGAGSLSELRYYQCPHIVVPLPAKYSRGDQIDNARYFQSKGMCEVIDQAALTPDRVQAMVTMVLARASAYRAAMAASSGRGATQAVHTILQAVHDTPV
ncbi:MAG: UDP-N-acetylglucosamine--N-acetylmuramyl-(pentapeptide) pyrophosphoryl-undecaprenol N-acetylglucosamine transferase [Candidatus Marinamargulisbacteria bacterium]|nr:UDP-N-acetylglucosamine--N-acetylmuramyl-(pentapeptide) pyrophosphoryl-undecaprenol N-acetylglucosamine transferase [bacterium]MDG2264558.1 UDP-N-acetylglucosamine--N-acetylmuramyl-(pentapeptide) pyrophosphoryl-undecaprenol N-acetylglucosamine transferase [Candidatus Marinamargulisbacteria bacterium]